MAPREGLVSGPRRCQGTNAKGLPCAAPPEFVDPETGYCKAHGPGGRERMKAMAARAVKAREPQPDGLTPEELPELTDHASAKARLDLIGRAVLTGRIRDKVAHAATRAVSEWVKAHEGQLVSEDVEALRGRLEELERELGRPALTREK